MVSIEDNKALTRRLVEEGFNQNKPGVFDDSPPSSSCR